MWLLSVVLKSVSSTVRLEVGCFKRLSEKLNQRVGNEMEEGTFKLQNTELKLNHQYHYILIHNSFF